MAIGRIIKMNYKIAKCFYFVASMAFVLIGILSLLLILLVVDYLLAAA